MTHAALTGQRPQYIRDIVHPLSTLPVQNRLRAAASGQFDLPRTRTVFGEKAFSVADPRELNTLPQDITRHHNREVLNELLRHIILNYPMTVRAFDLPFLINFYFVLRHRRSRVV